MAVEWLQKALYPEQWEQRETRIQQREGAGKQEIMKQKLANLQQKAQLAYQTGGPDAFRTVMSEGLPQIDPNLAKIFQQGQVQPGTPLFQEPLDPLEKARAEEIKARTAQLPAEAEREVLKAKRETEKWEEAKTEAKKERRRKDWSKALGILDQPRSELGDVQLSQTMPGLGIPPWSPGYFREAAPQRMTPETAPSIPGMAHRFDIGPFGGITGGEFQPEPTYKPGIIENIQTGQQRPYNYGQDIPSGWKVASQAATNINIGTITKPPAPSERTKIAETRASIDALNNLKALFDSAQTETGPIVGRVAPTKGLFGRTTGEQEAFMAATSAFKNAIIKQITGAQMSEVEANRIMKQIPDITDPPARWLAKWEQSKKNLEFLQKRRLEVLQQSGLRVPGNQVGIPEDIRNMSDEELREIVGVE